MRRRDPGRRSWLSMWPVVVSLGALVLGSPLGALPVLSAGEREVVAVPAAAREAARPVPSGEMRLARSEDLLSWTPLGTVLPFSGSGWDRWQADGSVALADPTWGGSARLRSYDGRYWFSYFGGEKRGYETDPLSVVGRAFLVHLRSGSPASSTSATRAAVASTPHFRCFAKKSRVLFQASFAASSS